jgi:hypothetical protein
VLPSAFSFSATAGTVPPAQSATLEPAGLPGLTVRIEYAIEGPSEWLSAELQSESTLVVNVATEGLAPGTHEAMITVETSDPNYTPAQAFVELTITQ